MHIQKVKITTNHRCFTEGEIYEFKPITLLVGDQGCGKSTLLLGLQNHEKFMNTELSENCQKNGVESFYFDAEKMNPRIVDPINYTNPNGTDRGIGIANAVKSRFASHGETMVGFTVHAIKKAKDAIVFLDEPESGLSLRNQFALSQEIINASQRGCQLFVATHSLVLIQSVDQVLSLEHKNWMSSEDFINSNKA